MSALRSASHRADYEEVTTQVHPEGNVSDLRSRLLIAAPHPSAEPGLEWSVGLTPFPHPASNAPSVQASVTPTLVAASMIFNIVVMLQSVVSRPHAQRPIAFAAAAPGAAAAASRMQRLMH